MKSSLIDEYIEDCNGKEALEEAKTQLKDDFIGYHDIVMLLYYGKFRKLMPSESDDDNEVFNTLVWSVGQSIASLGGLYGDVDKVYQCTIIFKEYLPHLKIDEVMNYIREAALLE